MRSNGSFSRDSHLATQSQPKRTWPSGLSHWHSGTLRKFPSSQLTVCVTLCPRLCVDSEIPPFHPRALPLSLCSQSRTAGVPYMQLCCMRRPGCWRGSKCCAGAFLGEAQRIVFAMSLIFLWQSVASISCDVAGLCYTNPKLGLYGLTPPGQLPRLCSCFDGGALLVPFR